MLCNLLGEVAAKESGVTPKGYTIYWNGGQTGTMMVKDEERSTNC